MAVVNERAVVSVFNMLERTAIQLPKVLGGLTFDQQIQKLFANNEQGFFYDPNDLSTMYQDAVGTVPVTAAGQPVGLWLDKSKSLLKTELIRDVSFDNPSNWNVQPTGATGVVITNGMLVCNSVSTDRVVQLSTAISANTRYTAEIDIVGYVRGDPLIICGGVEVYFPKSVGRHTVSFITSHTTSFISVYSGKAAIGGEWSASSISVTKVEGNHAYQTTSSMRPLLVASPQRLDYDTADDKLVTTLPAQLTGCTVIRAVPNVGTQILTNQTIPTPYNDNTDHCGLIVINRALTPSETSAITAEFNKRAGV